MNNWTNFDELGAVLIAVLIVAGTMALYILSAVFPGEIAVPNELKAVAAVVLAAYGFKLQRKSSPSGEKTSDVSKS